MTGLATLALLIAATSYSDKAPVSQSTVTATGLPPRRWNEGCLIHRGCGADYLGAPTLAPRRLERCEAKRPAAVSLGEALGQAAVGRTVRIAGILDRPGHVETTLVLCRPGQCCNETRAGLRLRPRGLASTRRRQYSGVSVPLSIGCRGDDSALCCGYEFDKPVEITGTWRRVLYYREPGWQLEPVSLCAP